MRLVVVEQLRLKQPIQPIVVTMDLLKPQQAKPELVNLTFGLEPVPQLGLGLQPFALESNRPKQPQKRCLQSTMQWIHLHHLDPQAFEDLGHSSQKAGVDWQTRVLCSSES